MYEMYPDAWLPAPQRRHPEQSGAQPRRRARKEHSVVPPVIALEPLVGRNGSEPHPS